MTPHKLSPQYRKAVELVNKYNKNPELYNKDQGEQIAQIAYMYDLPFEAESKGMKKLLYNMGEGLTLGMLPNSWEPREIGEDYGFESMSGKIGGGVGDLLGLAGGLATGGALFGAGAKGLKALGGLGGIASGAGNVASKVSSAGGNLADEAMHFAGKVSDKGKEALSKIRSRYYQNKYYKGAQPMTNNLLPQSAGQRVVQLADGSVMYVDDLSAMTGMVGPQRIAQSGINPRAVERAMSGGKGEQLNLLNLASKKRKKPYRESGVEAQLYKDRWNTGRRDWDEEGYGGSWI